MMNSNKLLQTANAFPLSLWERAGVRAFCGLFNNP